MVARFAVSSSASIVACAEARSARSRGRRLGGRADRADPDADALRDPGPDRAADPIASSRDAAVAWRLRPAEPAPERVSALLHDRLARRDPDPGPASAQG